MAFWVTYDHLGKLILANLMWSIAILAPAVIGATAFLTGDRAIITVIGVPLLIASIGIVLPVTTAGLAHLAKVLIDTRDGSVMDFFSGMRLYWRRAMGVGLFYLLALGSLAVSVWFYAAKLRDTAPWVGYAVSALALWCLVFIVLMSMFVMPALVQKKGTVLETLRLAGLLILDNPLFSIGLALQFAVWVGLSVVVIPLFVFLSGSVLVVLASSAYEILARKYAMQSSGVTAEPGLGRGSVRGISREAPRTVDDEQDDYLNRGLRDFLFPWKG